MGVKYHKAPLPSVCSSIAETGKKIQCFLSAHRENHAPAEAGRTAKIFCKTGRPFIPALCGICRLQKGLSPAHLFPVHGAFFPKASPSASPMACAGPVRACFRHAAQSAELFPFPPARKPAAIAISRASLQNAARPKRGARHFLPVFCSMHAPQAPVLGLPLSPLLPGDGGVLPSSYS